MNGDAKERPQNKNLKPLGSGQLTPEEELAIRRKGKVGCDKARRRNADIRAAVKAVANLSLKGKVKSIDVQKMLSVEQFDEDGVPLIAKLVYTQFMCALNGDKEARDWICKMLGVQSIMTDSEAEADSSNEEGQDNGSGVRIHLIRGEKPKEEESAEDAATRVANRLAVVDAMRAIGDEVSKATEDTEKSTTEDVNTDE